MHIDIEKCRKDTGRIQIKVSTAFLFCFLLTRLESAYSLNCGGDMIFWDRVEGRPWHFYEK